MDSSEYKVKNETYSSSSSSLQWVAFVITLLVLIKPTRAFLVNCQLSIFHSILSALEICLRSTSLMCSAWSGQTQTFCCKLWSISCQQLSACQYVMPSRSVSGQQHWCELLSKTNSNLKFEQISVTWGAFPLHGIAWFGLVQLTFGSSSTAFCA